MAIKVTKRKKTRATPKIKRGGKLQEPVGKVGKN